MLIPKNKRFLHNTRRNLLKFLGISAGLGAGLMVSRPLRGASQTQQGRPITVGVLALFYPKPGKEAELVSILREGRALVAQEPGTKAWFSFEVRPGVYGIFDVFEDQAGRQAHFDDEFTAFLFERLPELQRAEPEINLINVIAFTEQLEGNVTP
jgi:quinol monooxygenase YgiN